MIRSFDKRAEQKISGFQSPAADYLEGRLDLAEKLIVDPHSTFYFQMQGDAMNSYGISDADLLVTDRSLEPHHGALVITFISGNFSCRMFIKENGSCLLRNDKDTISETELGTLQVWGIVTSVCRNVLPRTLRRGRYSNVCTL